jgi:Carboxypeptidase regulatory-like domain
MKATIGVNSACRQPGSPQREGPGHLRTYNPGTTSLEEAEPIELRAGEEQSVSVRFVLVPFMSVSGVVTTSDGLPAMKFTVWLRGGPATIGYTGIRSGYMTTMVASTMTAADGSFSLSRVPAGAYTLTASNGLMGRRPGQPLEIGEMPLEVTKTSPTGIKLRTARGATVSGRLVWAGTGAVPWPRDRPWGRLRAAGVGLSYSDLGSIDSEVQPDGTFQFTNLYGLRRIEGMSLPFNWAIQSVEGPKEILAGGNLEITPGVDITDLKVVVTNRTSMLMATLVDENDKPLATGSLLLMPTDPADLDPLGWGFRATPGGGSNNGVPFWRMEGLLPGSYLAVAIDVEPYRLTGDTDLMERARVAAVRVEIPEGQTQTQVRVPVVRLRPFVRAISN